jgi:hypothetical protein
MDVLQTGDNPQDALPATSGRKSDAVHWLSKRLMIRYLAIKY